MNYRWQETIKILLPGFYILLYLGGGYFMENYQLDKGVCETISKLSTLLIVGMFFVAFILGYLNEIVSGGIEYMMYKVGIPRPSNLILNSRYKRFSVVKISDLKSKLGISGIQSIDNGVSSTKLALAKQTINLDTCQEFYYQSILARDLFFAHVIASIGLGFIVDYTWLLFGINLVLSLLFCWQWWKMNLFYVKRVFVEYLEK